MARPSSFSRQIQMALCEKIAQGLTVRAACDVLGLDEDTVGSWKRRGKLDGPENAKFRTFRRALARAKGAFKGRTMLALDSAIQGGFVVDTSSEEELNSRGQVIARRSGKRVTPPNGALALKVLQMRDPKNFTPDQPASVNVTLIQQIKQMESREGQLPDPRRVIISQRAQAQLPAPEERNGEDEGSAVRPAETEAGS